MKAFIIEINGSRTPVTPANGSDFKLEELQGFIKMEGNDDPCIQIVPLRTSHEQCVCEDNGIALGLPVNVAATRYCFGQVIMDGGMYGRVLICEPQMIE